MTIAPLSATAPKVTANDNAAKLKSAAQAFEAVFLRQMISSMRSAGLGDDILGSSAGDTFRDMGDETTAKQMADKGALGIADLLLKQLSKPAAAAAAIPAAAAPAPAPESAA